MLPHVDLAFKYSVKLCGVNCHLYVNESYILMNKYDTACNDICMNLNFKFDFMEGTIF